MALAYENGDLRDLMVGNQEVLRRVYMVFQDRNWSSRPWTITDEHIQVGPDAFEIAFDAHGTFDAAPFSFTARLTGDDEGTITYSVEGAAGAPFLRNRLGLCALHPSAAAGVACIIESVTGGRRETTFPVEISPWQPFMDVRAITHEFAPGAWARLSLTGETFETEDHRNWGDASFKTYCTPISLPFPVAVTPEDVVRQSLTISVDIEGFAPVPVADEVVISAASDGPVLALPRLGLQVARDASALTREEIDRLRALGLAHLRIDVEMSDPRAARRIADASAQAEAIGARLIVALVVADPDGLASFATAVDGVEVDSWLVFDAAAKVTSAELASAARIAFGEGCRVGGGTNHYFAELNREPPDTSALDVVAFSFNPQVHASDNETIVQNLATQGVIARSARRLAGTTPLHVGPVTLRPRFNPNATAPELDVSSTPLPANVDARQPSDLCAAWTTISIKYLAEAGTVDAVTYYETVGWRGVMERAAGSPQPLDFASAPGGTFPVYDALKSLAGFRNVRACSSNLPHVVDALIIEDEIGRQRLILASFADHEVPVRIDGFPATVTTVMVRPFGLEIIDSGEAGS